MIVSLLLTACVGRAEERPFSVYERKALAFRVHNGLPLYENNDPNARFFPLLLPGELQFNRLTAGQEIPLNSVIVMPNVGEKGMLTVEFRRRDLTEAFIRGLFLDQDSDVVKRHPFAHDGIEPILTSDKMILNLYPGAALHIRNDIEYDPNYMTFNKENITGRVIKVSGDVFCSSDRQFVRMKMRDFYASATTVAVFPSSDTSSTSFSARLRKKPDGSYEVIDPPGTRAIQGPKRFRPKVIE